MIQELITLSRYYGANPDYIVAGGGNTSLKDNATLFIKGSGTALADITADGFVRMDRGRLARIWEKAYPAQADDREAAVLADMMAAKMPGEENKRPSVETLLHDILPFILVVHTHPALVNGLTCSQGGAEEARRLFGERALWIPETNPGYVLSRVVKDAMEVHAGRTGTPPAIILLQNHGVFVGADTSQGIRDLYRYIMETLGTKIVRQPDFSGQTREYGPSTAAAAILADLAGSAGAPAVLFERNREIAALTEDAAAFCPVSSAFTPDHIVYSGSSPLFIETAGSPGEDMARLIGKAWKDRLEKTGRTPKIVALRKIGVFGIGPSEKAASLALELFTDTVKVAVYAQAFGGPRFMAADKIDFINNWEMERYRSGVSGISKK